MKEREPYTTNIGKVNILNYYVIVITSNPCPLTLSLSKHDKNVQIKQIYLDSILHLNCCRPLQLRGPLPPEPPPEALPLDPIRIQGKVQKRSILKFRPSASLCIAHTPYLCPSSHLPLENLALPPTLPYLSCYSRLVLNGIWQWTFDYILTLKLLLSLFSPKLRQCDKQNN